MNLVSIGALMMLVSYTIGTCIKISFCPVLKELIVNVDDENDNYPHIRVWTYISCAAALIIGAVVFTIGVYNEML